MRDKELKKILTEKANQIEVPDVKLSIKQRFGEIPPKPIKKSIFRRRFIEVMAFSMVLLIVATIAVLYGSIDTDPFLSTDDSLHEAVMMSSISTISVIDEDLTAASTEDYIILLAMGPPTTDDEEDEETEVEQNVDGVRRYLHLMEQVLTTNENYQYQRQAINRRQRRYQLSFVAASLVDEEVNYDVIYEVTDDNDENTQLMATITQGDEAYQADIIYQKDNQQITMRTNYQNGLSVEVSFLEAQGTTHYEITHYDGIDITEQVALTYEQKNQVSLSFIQGNAYGTYDFSLENGPSGSRKRFLIDYNIQDRYQGNISIAVSGTDNDEYRIVVTPHNRPSFVIERDRGRGRK